MDETDFELAPECEIRQPAFRAHRIESALGVVPLSEFADVKSAWEGSVRLYETGTDPDATRVRGFVSAQENIVNFVPAAPLEPGRQYTLEIPAGGLSDFSGNAIAEPFAATYLIR